MRSSVSRARYATAIGNEEKAMIELRDDTLMFTFPAVHEEARLFVGFQRTLRIPDDGSEYPLPPGLGPFPLRHVDDHAENVPAAWHEHGGVMLPMYQAEAMWLNFNAGFVADRYATYPFAVKIATGKINAVSGGQWMPSLHRNPQDYVVVPDQPWLDGYCVEEGVICQFVAMPLGTGYTAEEQVTGTADHGGIQIAVFPMKREAFERRFPTGTSRRGFRQECFCAGGPGMEMGLAPGGRMKQEIYHDRFDLCDWDTDNASRCFVHIANSMVWSAITGSAPPTVPPTSHEYTRAGLPWFDYYSENATALKGAETLRHLKSVAAMGRKKHDVPLPENESVKVDRVIPIRKRPSRDQVREGQW